MAQPDDPGASPGAPTFKVEIVESSDGADWTEPATFDPRAMPPPAPIPSIRERRDPSGGDAE